MSEQPPEERRGRIAIDMGDLVYAFESADYQSSYFLDLETGGLELIQEELDLVEQEEVREKIESHPDRYAKVPSIETREAYQDMVDFADSATDDRLGELLNVALHGKGAFRRFKDVLSSYPKERERWFSFKYERMRERVEDWLKDIGADYQMWAGSPRSRVG